MKKMRVFHNKSSHSCIRPISKKITHNIDFFLLSLVHQVDLYDWIHPLNVIDSALTWILNNYSQNILLLPSFAHPHEQPASICYEQIQQCPIDILDGTRTLLQFTTLLLRNASNKQLYSSIPVIADLMAAADDTIADCAFATVTALSIPQLQYKLQVQLDHQSTITQLHQASSANMTRNGIQNTIHRTDVHERLLVSARAYGNRSMGLGLYAIVSTDDSIYGYGSLPIELGEVHVTYTTTTTTQNLVASSGNSRSRSSSSSMSIDKNNNNTNNSNHDIIVSEETVQQQELHISLNDMQSGTTGMLLSGDGLISSPSPDHSIASISQNIDTIEIDSSSGSIYNHVDQTMNVASSKKRRKVVTAINSTNNAPMQGTSSNNGIPMKQIKSTAELFFLAIQRAGSLQNIPPDQWFVLLNDIRLARSFHTQKDRCDATKRRLNALIALLHTHPSNDVLTGYLQAQPDIGSDIADLLRPTVSSANISAASLSPDITITNNNSSSSTSSLRQDAIANLVNDTTQPVPFELRIVAVEALNALIARRNGTSDSLLTLAGGRFQSLLVDLGVGKGQYLGLLPTLIRYSLSTLSSIINIPKFSTNADTLNEVDSNDVLSDDTTTLQETLPDAFDIGLAFVEATLPPTPPRKEQLERAFRFIDNVLSLTSNIVGTSYGVTALVDCGLIPALVSTVSIDPNIALHCLVLNVNDWTSSELNRVKAWLRYITAQAAQILESVTVTSTNALTTFQDLKGIDVLVKRLEIEIDNIRKTMRENSQSSPMVLDDSDTKNTNIPSSEIIHSTNDTQQMLSSQRALIFCILTCLTVVFHQQSNTETTPISGAQLRTGWLTESLLEILTNVTLYGGHLVALVATLLADTLNNDPHLVSHVLQSGLAEVFLTMIKGKSTFEIIGVTFQPIIPQVPELIMAIPNVIAAFGLTDDGAKFVADRNPFPAFLRIFYHPNYAMPQSRCLLNEMTSIVGTGLEEIVRHVERLKPLVINAIADALNQIVIFASDLVERENNFFTMDVMLNEQQKSIDNERSCLIQFVLNFGQLLEQFLHNEDDCEPFVVAGGFDAILKLYPLLIPSPCQFLPFASCLSSPSVSTLHHSTTEEALNVACECIALRYDSVKVLMKLMDTGNRLLDELQQSQLVIQSNSCSDFLLDQLPQEPVYKLRNSKSKDLLLSISVYLRNVANIQWITNLIANILKSANERSNESIWNRVEKDWKNVVASVDFSGLIARFSDFQRSILFEVCRVRSDDAFKIRERIRFQTRSSRVRYRLRIVCTEGAVVRDGIEIDSCSNVGSLEMGDIVESSDRCINSSGILRYRTSKGWVSEMTRGHGREPIAEVIDVWECEDEIECEEATKDRIEAGVPDVRSVAVGVLARCQASSAELFSALAKLIVQGVRTLSLPADFENNETGSYISNLTSILFQNFKRFLTHKVISARITLPDLKNGKEEINDAGVTLYLGSALNQLHLCLFDEKRERRAVNLPLLIRLLVSDSSDITKHENDEKICPHDSTNGISIELFRAIGFVFRYGLSDFARRASEDYETGPDPDYQRICQSVASSFPPIFSLLRKFTSTPLSSTPIVSIMSRLKWKDVSLLLGIKEMIYAYIGAPNNEDFFHPESLMADFLLCMSNVLYDVCCDERIRYMPPYILHPLVGLIGDLMTALEDMSKKKVVKSISSHSDRLRLSELLRVRQPDNERNGTDHDRFEASEESILRLIEMGFSRGQAQRALERNRSNRVENAMDHLLSSNINRLHRPVVQVQSLEGDNLTGSQSAVEREDDRSSDVPQNSTVDSVEMEVEEGANSETSTTCDLLAKDELHRWIKAVPTMICKVLNSIPLPSTRRAIQASGRVDSNVLLKTIDGDAESEALTVVLCSFLLELCNKYPDTRTEVVSMMISRLDENISVRAENGNIFYYIEDHNEASFSALCHASVLMTRSLPKTRLLVLEKGISRKMVGCMKHSTDTMRLAKVNFSDIRVPMWLTPAMLLLEVMSQPIVAFSNDELMSSISVDDENSELEHVRKQHRDKIIEISKIVDRWFVANPKIETPPTSVYDKVAQNNESVRPENGAQEDEGTQSFISKVPAYFALLPTDVSRNCLEICRYILFNCTDVSFSTGLIQSTLLLLLWLLRPPKVAAECLQAGFAEVILRIPDRYAFIGSSGVVTIVVRRLIVDESTLIMSMESDIRAVIMKLHAKQSTITNSKDENPKVPLVSFMEATSHLFNRDPTLFFKAMALSLFIETHKQKSDGGTVVSLLSPAARTLVFSSYEETITFESTEQILFEESKDECIQEQLLSSSSSQKEKNRSPRFGSVRKKGKKEKNDVSKIKKVDTAKAMETPASRLTGLLVQSIVASTYANDECEDEREFLSTHDRIDILADLVIAVPACACAVHNHRLHRAKDKSRRGSFISQTTHALRGCPSPPRSFITFLLHTVLPQNTWSLRNDPQIWGRLKDYQGENLEFIKKKKRKAYHIMKTAQSTGRLLLSLVLRPGEGRKRVIADLTFALSGGRLGHGATSFPSDSTSSQKREPSQNSEIQALHVWAELCIAIAAPRNKGKNLDTFSSLNLENIRIMLECGIVHALFYALHRVKIYHPMSSNTYSTLLLPLEILTRGSVSDAVENLIKKDLPLNIAGGQVTLAAPTNTVSELNTTGQPDDELLLDVDVHRDVDVNMGMSYDVLVEVESHEMHDGNSNDIDDILDDDADDDEDDESSNSDESGEREEEESLEDSQEDDIEDEDMSEESESVDESNDSQEVEDETGWDVDNHNTYDADGRDYDDGENEEEEEEIIEDNNDAGADEGWTRIESNGLGRVLMERNGGFSLDNELRSRGFMDVGQARGFVDAAEAMINSLFRNEDISSDALAEIEGTLGIRIMRGRNSRAVEIDRTHVEPIATSVLQRHEDLPISGTDRSGRNDVIGTIPRVRQRNQPVIGYSGFGRSVIMVGSMEYVYGGPTVTGRSQNYDVVTKKHEKPDEEEELNFSQLDLQVFPNGPAVVVGVRMQYLVHPLLCDIDLPPFSALVSDLLPHGVRATRREQATVRRRGEWSETSLLTSMPGYLLSSSNGNVIRSSRPNVTGRFGGSNFDTPLGWIDEGLPVDSTAQEFSVALGATLEQRARATLPENENLLPEVESVEQNSQDQTVPVRESDREDHVENEANPTATMSAQTAVVDNNITEQLDGIPSDGGRVESYVADLQLSTQNENGESTGANMTDETQSQNHNSEGSGIELQDNATAQSNLAAQDVVGDTIARNDIENPAQEILSSENNSDSASRVEIVDENILMSNDESGIGNDAPESATNSNGLICPPDVDIDVFNSLPIEMQQDCVDQYRATQELAAQLSGSTLDPEVLAALPEEMRREVIEQERQERRMREEEEARADPSNAEEMDNASFLASLSPDLREEILLTGDEVFLNSLPPGIIAEAHILRERASVQHRRHYETTLEGQHNRGGTNSGSGLNEATQEANGEAHLVASLRRQRGGKLKVETDRANVLFVPDKLTSPFSVADLKTLFVALYLLDPIQPPKLLQKIFVNLCSNFSLRDVIISTLICLLREDGEGSKSSIESLSAEYEDADTWKRSMDILSKHELFPPRTLIGVAPKVSEVPDNVNLRQGIGSAVSLALTIPKSSTGVVRNKSGQPPVIAVRLMDTMLHLCKSPKFCFHALVSPVRATSKDVPKSTCFEQLLDLLEMPVFSNSSSNLEMLLTLFETIVAPLSNISRISGEDEVELPQRDIDAASAVGKEYVDIPQLVVSQRRLQLLCSILRMETCRDSSFTKVNTIIRRLCRVEANRGYVLAELASVAHGLGADAMRDLRALRIRMDNAATRHCSQQIQPMDTCNGDEKKSSGLQSGVSGSISSSVTLSTSTSETKLLRVLQTLHALCNDNTEDQPMKKNENSVVVTEELVHLLRQMKFDDLWDELSTCLKVVQILEGVRTFEEEEQKDSEELEANDDGSTEDAAGKKKKLRNSAAGLLARFLPSIEAFFIANACSTRPSDSANKGSDATESEVTLESLVGGDRVLEFVSAHRVLINALIRNNSSLLDKGFRALVQIPRCRVLLDFDVKRQWFKAQVRRLRQHASRRHGSLRLSIRRKSVFEDAYHQLQPRNADEMRGRLHVTFRNEEGVDAGGLSREFFSILAKEIFNPNYALFTSTEDGCTFQPNPNSMINPDHLSYFRFVGRVVGKAVADGYLLDAHFTRSLYKHMLGIQPTHHDMEAIDPDYYRNLKTILEYNLLDVGLDLTFSIEDHSFGRSQVIDLIPNGRSVPVTEENKEEYVRLVCQHRMTTSIQSQIKSYLAGFYELVSPELIAIFSPRELELLISGLPDIDVHDLKEHTDYVGWKSTDQEITWFWNILFGLTRNEKASFLQFVTGSSKVPLSGFADLQGMRGVQKFAIHKMSNKKGALMSAHTCFNSLDLPNYDSEDEMKQKFLFAINEGGGGFLFA
jgi:E3 ubiquitin-protein ligase HUWE1